MANNLPFDWALNLADALSEYTSTIFKELIDADSTTRKGKAPGIPDLLRISVHLAAECEHAATVLATAYKNQIVIPWRMDEYSACLPKQQAASNVLTTADRLLDRFPPISPKIRLSDPATIVDARGSILVWYLPEILLRDRKIALQSSVTMLNRGLTKPSSAKNSSWRQSADLFKTPEPGSQLVSGEIKMSPAQFQLGHTSPKFSPEVSRTLKAGNEHTGCRQWLQSTEDGAALLSAILGVAHPGLYTAGRLAFAAMQGDNTIAECLRHWGSVFSGLNLIVNRRTPPHRDTGTQPEWYDLLATIGGDDDTEMELANLGVTLAYRSGCVALFSGACILHTVPETVADRTMCPICRPARIMAKSQRRTALEVSFDPDNRLCYTDEGGPYEDNGMCPGRKLKAIRKKEEERLRQDEPRRRREMVEGAKIYAELLAEEAEARRIARQHAKIFEKRAAVNDRRRLARRFNIPGRVLKSYRLDSE